MAVITDLTARVKVRETGTNTGLRLPDANHTWEMLLSMVSGTSDSQSDLVWSDTRSLASTTENLDLAGVLTDSFGATITFAEVTLIAFRNKNTTAGQPLLVGGGANPFINWKTVGAEKMTVGPNGILLMTSPVDGWAVTATTGDIILVDSGAATVTYDVLIVGRSA